MMTLGKYALVAVCGYLLMGLLTVGVATLVFGPMEPIDCLGLVLGWPLWWIVIVVAVLIAGRAGHL